MGEEEQADRQVEQQADELARMLGRIADHARQIRSQGQAIPVLDADPPVDDPTNEWMFDDGRRRYRGADGTVHEILPTVDYRPAIPTFATNPLFSSGWRLWFHGGTGELRGYLANGTVVRYAPVTAGSSGDGGTGSAGGSTTTKPKPTETKTVKRERTYTPTWARAFCPSHGVETGASLYYGDSVFSSHGQRKIMIGFDDAAIRADLNGSINREVWIKAHNDHAYANSGVDIRWGGHNRSGPPGAYSSVRERVWTDHWPKVGYGAPVRDGWRKAPLWFANQLRDGNIRGLTINQQSGADPYYGAIDWDSIRLRVIYTVEV